MVINLPTGNWNISANGWKGSLVIKLDDNGNIKSGSTIFGNNIIGFYDKATGKLTFTRIGESNPENHQIYTGYVFYDAEDHNKWYIAGEFIAYGATGGSASRANFGWLASLLIVP
ncbi:hypothetical protein RclHR1_00080038 [Rhizophagus clarus]|uniref:Uncharacterized protein n=1 Tax=Rhizophagus clarus TaxID=94130 RepID=A0A2Z6S1A3_9GLOM|nr:hypothetical protein RclHR1_00080038 [Rhizophagus clarus]GES89941.1 hypothetical protein RCL2_001680600 [Rhizophagus clarus]